MTEFCGTSMLRRLESDAIMKLKDNGIWGLQMPLKKSGLRLRSAGRFAAAEVVYELVVWGRMHMHMLTGWLEVPQHPCPLPYTPPYSRQRWWHFPLTFKNEKKEIDHRNTCFCSLTLTSQCVRGHVDSGNHPMRLVVVTYPR